jgi:hypothetical protein
MEEIGELRIEQEAPGREALDQAHGAATAWTWPRRRR